MVFKGEIVLKEIYLDNSATTPVSQEVIDEMLPYFNYVFGNASSIHHLGQKAKKAIEASREKAAFHIGSKPDEIIFTGGGTESDNLAIIGAVYADKKQRKHIITSKIEHPAVLNTCNFLEKNGFKVTYLPVDKYGIIEIESLKESLSKDTVLVSVMTANNETGVIQPIKEISEIIKNYSEEIVFHTDAVQAVGKVPVNVEKLGVDLLSASAHKIYGPKGVGLLYKKSGIRLQPMFHGGHHEKNLRPGTENVPGIVGLAKALELFNIHDMEEIKKMRDHLENSLIALIPNVYVNGHIQKRVPNVTNLAFEYIEGEGILLSLDLKGIVVSTGSACASGEIMPSHVLKAMGIPDYLAQGCIRFSLGRMNTMEDIGYVIEIMPEIVKKLRAMSPLCNA